MHSPTIFCLSLLLFFCFAEASVIKNLSPPSINDAKGNPCGGDGWHHWAEGEKCMKMFPARTGWNVAEINCGYQGGHHISVRDAGENQFVAAMVRGTGQPIWLGAAQFGQSRDYVWVDGSPFRFEHWQNNARPQFHRGKKCVKLDAEGQWVQSCCRVPAASICQRPAPRMSSNQIQEDLSALSAAEREQFRL